MLAHLARPLTRRYRTEMLGQDLGGVPAGPGGGEGGQPHRIAGNAIFAVAFLLSAVLVGLATVALY
ncbi:hypothetical protein AB0F72_15520 [Actinoplanes sp. NPDC023936]|uniref:hypothetical protein n=1 Tax=Actinoplanes sp. NPDC023936 TaxID=3154910 RepID=UPI0033EC261F